MTHLSSAPAVRGTLLAEKSDAVCRMGAMMLRSGTGSYRVKLAMGRVASSLGIDKLEAQVSLTEIVVTTRMKDVFRTQVVEVGAPAVNTARISELMRMSVNARRGIATSSLQKEMDEIEKRKPLYPAPLVIAATALACASFAFLNQGSLGDCVSAALASAAAKLVQLGLHRLRQNPLAVIALTAAVACGSYLLLGRLLALVGSGEWMVHPTALTSAMLFLVPGFPLLTAALDLARFDYTSGLSRLAHAAMITAAAGTGAWLVAWSAHLSPSALATASPTALLVVVRGVASAAGVLGFALTFNTPGRLALIAAGIGGVVNTLRLSAIDLDANTLVCAALSTLVVGLGAGLIAKRIRAPRITLSVPAVLIMVPGATTYKALVAGVSGDTVAALAFAITSVSVIVALAAGLTIARMLTDPGWTDPRPIWTRVGTAAPSPRRF